MKSSEIRIVFVIIFIVILRFCSSHMNSANINHNLRHQHHNIHRLVENNHFGAFDLSNITTKSKERKSSVYDKNRPIIKFSSNIPGKHEINITNTLIHIKDKTHETKPFKDLVSDPPVHRNGEWESYNGKVNTQPLEDISPSEAHSSPPAKGFLQKAKLLTNDEELNRSFDFYEDDVSDPEFNDQLFSYTRVEKYRNNVLKRRSSYFESEDAFALSYIPGSLTKHKYETLGTHDAVQNSRKSLMTNHHHKRDMAKKHAKKVDLEARCKWPKPKIEKVQKETSKIYVPHCTVLHRCADDTGCCVSDQQTCVAKHSEKVSLYFFVKSLGSTLGSVEVHTFINHTECECVDRSHYNGLTYFQQNTVKHTTKVNCVCPRLFETVLQEDGCRCDCSSGNSGCDSLKRGMEHFSLADRKCINEGRCKIPTCEYGFYVRKRRIVGIKILKSRMKHYITNELLSDNSWFSSQGHARRKASHILPNHPVVLYIKLCKFIVHRRMSSE